jgi:hypothetical protein
MRLQRTRRPRLRSGRSLRSLGSPLKRYPLGGRVRERGVMSRKVTAALGFAVLTLASAPARGNDVFVVRFDTTRAPAPFPPCGGLVYRDELIFHNRGPTGTAVVPLGVSNGVAANPEPLTLPAGMTRSSEGSCDGCAAPSTWAPDPQPLLWVARLDVPDEVDVISRLLVLAGSPPACNGFPGPSARTYAGLPMPVVRTLVPADVPQFHLGTDIGGDSGGTADDGRTNVGIYNGGAADASASVELRRGCDGVVLERRTTIIPANTIIQLNGFSNVFTGCTDLNTGSYEAYVVVTVDQPSFSYAVTLSNARLPLLSASSSP